MTKRQTQPSAGTPSLGSIIYNGALGVAVLAATFWIAWGAQTGREYAGATLGVMLTLGLLANATLSLIARSTTRVVARRRALEQALAERGYTAEDGRAWLEREPGSPFYKPGPY